MTNIEKLWRLPKSIRWVLWGVVWFLFFMASGSLSLIEPHVAPLLVFAPLIAVGVAHWFAHQRRKELHLETGKWLT